MNMKYAMMLLAFMLVACANEPANTPPIQSRSIERMSDREAQLLGLDKAAAESQFIWAGPKIHTMAEAQALAASDGKKILVDVYTVWCGFCRKMAAETYPNAGVKEKVDEYFHLVRLDAEGNKEVTFNGDVLLEHELAAILGVSSFPTTIFIQSDGEPLGLQPGFLEAGMFSNLLGFVGSDAFRTRSFEDYVRN
jgi:thioredoxin-related protein